MASVILVSPTGAESTVTSTRDFNQKIYNEGYIPQTGTVEENYNILLSGSGTPSPNVNKYVLVGDITNFNSSTNALLRDNFLAPWIPYEVVAAGDLRLNPTGNTIKRNTAGTSRGAYDATEQALWTIVSGGSSAGTHTHDEYALDTDVTAASTADRARTNHTGLQTLDTTTDTASRIAMTPAERTKLTGVATGATANASNAELRDRSTHTGTQISGTISDLTETVQDIVAAFISPGTGLTKTYDDTANILTLDATGGGTGGGATDPEIVRDTIGSALTAGAGITVVLNDAGDTITIASTAVLPTRQVATGTGLSGGGDLSANRTIAVAFGTTAGTVAEGNHGHASTAITDFAEAAQDVLAAALLASGNITVTYDDAAGKVSLAVPESTTLVKGVIETATNTEAIAGLATGLAMTPASTKAVIDAASASLVTVLADTDQIVNNSTTFVNDVKLLADLEANAFYMIDVFLILGMAVGGGASTDLKITWTVPSGTTGFWGGNQAWNQPGAASASTGLLVGLTTTRDFTLQEGTQGVTARALVYSGATAGQMQMRWAQNTAAAFDLTRYAGSNLLVRKMS